MNERQYQVLFVCTANSARSVIAECLLNRAGNGRFRAYSAGSTPAGAVHPFALRLLERQGFAIDALRSKSWGEFSGAHAPQLDFVFTVCDRAAREPCPIWPGQPMSAHWGIPDPAAAHGNEAERHLAFAETYRMLSNRIDAFVSLPLASLDRLSLAQHLERIGADGR
jgi:arsenate reductase